MLLFADDFKGYGTDQTLLLNGLWGVVGAEISTDPDPNASGNVIRFRSFGNGARRVFTQGPLATVGVALRLWMTQLPSFTSACIRMLDGGNNLLANIAITPTGIIEAYNGSVGHGGVYLGGTTGPVLTATAYHHIEVKFVMSLTVGTLEVRVDGAPVLVLTGLNMGAASSSQVALGTTNDYNGTASRDEYIKDFVVWNSTGTYNNDFLGTVSVVSLTPASDVAPLNWTPSSGTTGFNLVNASPPNDSVNFIKAPFPLPGPASFALTSLPVNVTTVRGIITQVRARKEDGGDGSLQSALVSGESSSLGANRPITTAATYYEDVFEVDPATSVPWTPAGTNAAKLKLNRTV
jgi:hypothetical protein